MNRRMASIGSQNQSNRMLNMGEEGELSGAGGVMLMNRRVPVGLLSSSFGEVVCMGQCRFDSITNL